MKAYTTISGDVWDVIAKKVYGSELLADLLMANNFDLLDILVFPSGMTINIPDKPPDADMDLPPWRR
ncbi:MAG: tail protein X [Clostridiales bacterium]|jgi:phage tail protein X|nr:tail protein X [Clostridiales bacterium]